MVIKREIVIKPQDIKNITNSVSDHWLAVMESKSQKMINIICDECWHSSLNAIPCYFFKPKAMAVYFFNF